MTVTASDALLFIISGAMMIALVSMVIISILNKKRFLEVCRLYQVWNFAPCRRSIERC